MKARSFFRGSLAGVMLLNFALACSFSNGEQPSASPPSERSSNEPPLPNTMPAESTIGPQGGEVRHPSGAVLVVPPGALAEPVAITLTEAAALEASRVKFIPVGPAFEAGPDGTVFQVPVEIRLPFEPGLVPNGATVGARMAPHGSSVFEALPAAVTSEKIVTTHSLHFTTFVAAADLGLGDDDAGMSPDGGASDAGPTADSSVDAGTTALRVVPKAMYSSIPGDMFLAAPFQANGGKPPYY